jgi:superfamily II DNA or RNA helicase
MTDVHAQFAELPPTEQRILEVLAVAHDPITYTDLVAVLKALGQRAPDGKAWKTSTLRELVEALPEGLVDAHHRCARPLRVPLARGLVERGELEDVAAALDRGWPVTGQLLYRRQIRLAALRGDVPALVAAWDAHHAEAMSPLEGLYGQDAVAAAALPAPVFDRLAREVFDTPPGELAAVRTALRPLLEEHVRSGSASEEARVVFASELVWCGRGAEALELLSGLETAQALLARGRAHITCGEGGRAAEAFERARVLLGKPARLDPIDEAFSTSALLARGDAASLATAQTRLARGGPPGETLDHLQAVLRYLQTGAKPERRWYFGLGAPDVTVLLQAVSYVWMYVPVSDELRPRLEKVQVAAEAVGHRWIVQEARALLAGRPGTLGGLVRAPEPWRTQLDALARLEVQDKPTATPPPQETKTARLAWLLGLHPWGVQIAPREQKRNARGWTGGRPIALKRLYEAAGDFPYLTDQDRRILAHLKREARVHRGYLDESFDFDRGPALAAMVGHPLLLWEEDGTPVRLERGEPALHVEALGDELLLRFEPQGKDGVGIRRVAADALELVLLESTHQAIARVLGDGLRVPRAAEEELRAIVERLSRRVPVRAAIRGWGAREIAADSKPQLSLSPAGDGLRLRIVVEPLGPSGPAFELGKGQPSVVAPIEGSLVQAERDLPLEREHLAEIHREVPVLQGALREGPDYVLQSAEDGLELLLALGRLGDRVALRWPPGVPRREVFELPASALSLTVRSDRDGLVASGALQLGDGSIELGSLLALLEASPGRFVPLSEGRFAALTSTFRERLELLRRLGVAEGEALRFPAIAAGLVDELSAEAKVKADKAFRERIARIDAAQALEPELPATLRAELRGYQRDGFIWLARLAEWGAGACLADDMGVGKTVQTLALLLRRAPGGPALVVAPTSVVSGWLEEARRFAPTLDVQRFGAGDRAAMLSAAGPYTVVVASYGLVQSEQQALSAIRWHTLVLDEAQQIKNSATQRFLAVTSLGADFRMTCTGTPIQNHLGELWSQMHFLNPGLLGTEAEFKRRFRAPIERERSVAAESALRRLCRPFLLRRTKAEVLHELPARTEVTLRVELGAEEAAVYEALRQRALEALSEAERRPNWRLAVLAEITRLRQAACNAALVLDDAPPPSAKLAALEDLLLSLREGGHRALVFSQFVRHLALVRERLDALQVGYQYLDGSTPVAQRQQAVAQFQAGEGDLFLISLAAGGFGLNLTAADYVVHLDPWWNPAVEDQASDRAHRLGQTRPVTVYRLVAQGTIEEKIVALHQRKRELATGLLSGADGGGLTAEALLDLLRGGSDDALVTPASGGRPLP